MRRLVVHCSATSPLVDVGAAEIDRWHRQRGWSSIGYHHVIRRNGEVEQGRPEYKTGAHARGFNTGSLGICLVGGVDKYNDPENNFTKAQWDSLAALMRGLKNKYPGAEVLGHRDLSPDIDGDGIVERHEWLKDCPCFGVKDWWRSVA